MKKFVVITILSILALIRSVQLFAQSTQTVTDGDPTTAINFSPGCTYNWVNTNPSIGLPASGTGNIGSSTAINTGSTAVTATITATPSAAGFAYIANYSGTVSVINIITHSVVATIPVGNLPWGVAISKDGSRVYVTKSGSNTVSVISTSNNSVIGTIPVGSVPHGIAVSPDGSRVYVANTGPNNVSPMGPNTISVINTATQTLITDVGVGLNPIGVAVSPDGKKIFVTNEISNTVSVISAATNTVSATIMAGAATWGITVSPDGGLIYMANPGSNTVSVISTATNSIVGTISVTGSPSGVALNPDGSRLYVTCGANATLNVINTADNTVLKTIGMDSSPCGISVSDDGKEVYVADYNSNNIVVIGTATNTRSYSIPTGDVAFSMGNFISAGPGCNGSPLTFTITVKPTPAPASLSITGSLQPLHTVYGTPSSAETFTVSGQNIADAILISPPAGFEVSTNGIDFSSTVSITGSGNISAPVYIRLAATAPADNYGGPIKLTTSNASTLNVTMPVSIVTPAALTIVADDKSRPYGTANPLLTLTYEGFVNHEEAAQLTVQPRATTSATPASAVGQYPIIPDGGASANYYFTYIQGVLTIGPALITLSIPNTFTPNGDGINDTWVIGALDYYPGCTVNIFNRWGRKLFSSIGYASPWDGKYNGAALPSGTYYYVIDPRNGKAVISGWVTIIR